MCHVSMLTTLKYDNIYAQGLRALLAGHTRRTFTLLSKKLIVTPKMLLVTCRVSFMSASKTWLLLAQKTNVASLCNEFHWTVTIRLWKMCGKFSMVLAQGDPLTKLCCSVANAGFVQQTLIIVKAVWNWAC